MDWDNRDSRCTQNVMLNCGTGIFIEASVVEPFCKLDRNVIWGAKQGIYEHDCKNQTFVHNFIGHSELGLILRGKVTERIISGSHPAAGGGHSAANNAFVKVDREIDDTTSADSSPNALSGNVFSEADLAATLDMQRLTLTLTAQRPLAAHCDATLVNRDVLDRPWPQGVRSPGPIPLPDAQPVEFRLDWWRTGEP
jgi:hypothetical protein